MPYITCIVSSCNTRRNPNTHKSETVKCFSFPKDPVLKKEWLDLCHVQEFVQASDSSRKVCIKHFKEDDFVDGLKARLMNLQPRILKKNAVPSLYLTSDAENENSKETRLKKEKEIFEKMLEEAKKTTKPRKRTKNIYKEKSKEYLSKLVPIAPKGPSVTLKTPLISSELPKMPLMRSQVPTNEPQVEPNEPPIASKRQQSPPTEPKCTKYPKISRQHENSFINANEVHFEYEFKILQHDNAKYKKLISELTCNQEELKTKIKELETKIEDAEINFGDKIKVLFSHFLTPVQLEVILGKVQPCWTDIELAKAYNLFRLGKKAYIYVRNTLKYPFPSLSSLTKWATKMHLGRSQKDNKIGQPMPKHVQLQLEDRQKVVNNYDIESDVRNNSPGQDNDVKNEQDKFSVKSKGEDFNIDETSNKIETCNEIFNDINVQHSECNINGNLTVNKDRHTPENHNIFFTDHDYTAEDCTDDVNSIKTYIDDYNDKIDYPISEQMNNIDEDTDELYEELITDNLSEHDVINDLIEDKSSIIEKDNG